MVLPANNGWCPPTAACRCCRWVCAPPSWCRGRTLRQAVSEACIATITVLQRASDLPPLALEWASVALYQTSRASRRSQPPRGVGSTDPLGGAARSSGWSWPRGAGQPADRRLFALVQQAQLGLLPCMTATADLMLPIVSFTAEGDVSYGCVVTWSCAPWPRRRTCCSPRTAPHDWPQGRLRRRPRRRTAHGGAAPKVRLVAPATASAAVVPAAPTPQGYVQELVRDHAILHALCICLHPVHGNSVGGELDDMLATVRAAPAMQSHSDAPLRQACRWVMTEVIKLAQAYGLQQGLSLTWSTVAARPQERRQGRRRVCGGTGRKVPVRLRVVVCEPDAVQRRRLPKCGSHRGQHSARPRRQCEAGSGDYVGISRRACCTW